MMTIFRKLFVTKRYFVVSFFGSVTNGKITGQSSICVSGRGCFLQMDSLIKHIMDKNEGAFDIVITGFYEMKKFEFDTWTSK
jgi:hypothetical protein